MPSNKPRLALTLPQHRYDLLERLARLQGVSKASIIMELMDEAWPVLERVCVAIEAVQRMQEDVKPGFREACDQVVAELEPYAKAIGSQFDLFINGIVTGSAVADGGEPSRSDASPPVAKAAGVDPRPVIRGSGSPTSPPTSPQAKPSKALRHKESKGFSSSKTVEKIDGCTCKVTKRERQENPTCPVHRKEGR